ncbi:sigma-54-dependent Fis family transcriptional regulator [Altericroceibacterium spongiae]|uniref:Sigma-54-dependent Fis family transcriptional regulator n=2 Tax=Altericroceibacterium spongiae TaxID=2320269 RepID=A0A420EQQ3_9SPHN|nr:GAF domain-containing protein [Altericroceibacterium spongiae]RKF23018.1 sigma-54-dependent Fis family transcriptional regulator [Altericroceibacterium spongiae]
MADQHHSETVLQTVQSPSSAAISHVAASWCRSALHHGLDPDQLNIPERIDAPALTALRQKHEMLLAAANPVLDQMFRSVGRSGCGVVFSDAEGTIMERRTSAGDEGDFSHIGLAEGARWSEAQEGTNGIGTCLYEDKPVVIHRDQHFASRNIGISCMDAPVHDPHGKLIAALDISSCRSDHGPAMVEMIAALVRDAAQRIERDYFCRHFADNRIVLLKEDEAHGAALLATDRDDLVIGASRAARLHLGLDDKALSEQRPLEQILGTGQPPSFEDGDRTVLRRALAQAGGNASEAARLLGIGRATLYRRMNRAGVRH